MKVRPPSPRVASAGSLLARKLREVDAELAAAIPRVIKEADDEAIHDLRERSVACARC